MSGYIFLQKPGICPLNPNAFTDTDFAPSFVTDRPVPPEQENIVAVSNVNKLQIIYTFIHFIKNYLNRLFF